VTKQTVRRKNRLLALGVLIILGLLFAIEYLLLRSERFSPSFIASSFFVWALWNLCVLVLLILLFMLLRNLVKLYLERRRDVPGARFRSRLVFFFISLSLIPTLLLFFFASDLILRTLERWFRLPLNTIVADAEDVAERYYADVTERAFLFAQLAARQIRDTGLYSRPQSGVIVQERLEEWLKRYHLDLIALYDGEDLVLQTVNSRLPVEQIQEMPDDQVRRCLEGEPRRQIDTLPQGELVRSMIPYFEPGGEQPSGAVVVGIFLDDSIARKVKAITTTARQHSQTYVLRDPIRTTYFLILLFVTLLILFAATWSGLHLAREITVPIEQLAQATREVAAGNLDCRVNWKSTDELGSLVDSFNRMIEDLRLGSKKLSLSKIYLEETNAVLEQKGLYIEALLQNIAAGVISIGSDRRVRTANAAALNLLGLREIAPQGKDAVELLQGLPELSGQLDESLRYQDPIEEREITIKVAGRTLTLALSTSFLKEPGGGSEMLVVLNDLTQLIRAQRMETWKEVARRIAHEIKNPLTPIQLSAQRIWKNFEKGSPNYGKIVREGTETIIREVTALKDMVNEFGSFARMPSLQLVPGDLNKLIRSTVGIYDGIFSSVAFSMELNDALPPVAVDSDQLKRALINIVDNAVEAMNQNGTLTIRTSWPSQPGPCRIEICDTGPGVAPEDREKVFLPYFSTKKRGSGLGLAIVHQIILDHNGTIRVDENQPSGTRFVIELPVSGPVSAAAAPPAES